MKANNHLKDKDHLLRRSESLLRESSQQTSQTAAFDVSQNDGPLRTRRDLKMKQYYRDLQLWVEGGES